MIHYQKRKIIVFTFFIVLALPMFGQADKFNIKTNESTYYEIGRGYDYFKGSGVSFSARFDKFLNSNYSNNLRDKSIKHAVGFEMSYSHMLFKPVELEITGFNSTFKISNLIKNEEESSVRHSGFEIYTKAYVLPYIGKISEYVAPFVAIGYQFSSLNVKDYKDVNAKTSSFIYKAGTRIRLGSFFFLQAEYKQTFPKKDERLFRAYSVGLGVNYKFY